MGKKTEPELDEDGNPIPPQHQETDPEGDDPIDDDDTLGKFKKIRENYENKLSDKDKEIEKLKEQLKAKDIKVDETIDELTGEVNEKLEQAEKMKELQNTVNELVKDKAEATVDKFIQQGKIAPAQRESALKLCLSDNDTFMALYENAKPIVQTENKRISAPAGIAESLMNYFKK